MTDPVHRRNASEQRAPAFPMASRRFRLVLAGMKRGMGDGRLDAAQAMLAESLQRQVVSLPVVVPERTPVKDVESIAQRLEAGAHHRPVTSVQCRVVDDVAGAIDIRADVTKGLSVTLAHVASPSLVAVADAIRRRVEHRDGETSTRTNRERSGGDGERRQRHD